MALVPTGQNADFYQNGRGQARYRGQRPMVPDPPAGTAAYWVNEGIKDAWQGVPSRTGRETVFNDANGNPLPVVFGGGGSGQATADYSSWADDYWLGYLWTLQNPPLARYRLNQTTVWSSDYRQGIADALAQNDPADPRGLVPTPEQLQATGLFPNGLPRLGGGGGGGPFGGGIVIRTPPPAPPRGNPGDGVFVPPPGAVQATFELYGISSGRTVPLDTVLLVSGSGYRARPRTRIGIARSPGQGFGLAGTPGAWTRYYPTTSPANYGLDSRFGVLKWDDRTRRGYAIPVSQLVETFGPNWQPTVYGY